MSIKNTIQKGVNTIFKVLKSIVYPAVYTDTSDDGFSVAVTVTHTVDVIIDSFSERDVQFLSFSELIQPQDVKGLIRGSQLPVFPTTTGTLTVTSTDAVNGKYSVIAATTDAATALYTVLLRRV